MGRPPSNGSPSFRFSQAEIAEMEAILQAHKTALPERQVLVSLAEKFSKSEERLGKTEVQIKQVWNWFQNRRFAIRAKAAKATSQLNPTQMAREDSAMVKGVPQATQPHAASSATVKSLPQALQLLTVPSAPVRTFPQAPQHPPAFSVQTAGRVADNSQMEYEAKSARDGAWYDVSTFLSHRSLETGDPEALVRFAGFGVEEDEWVNVCKHVRQRSLPCESSECVAVLPADLILCFQEGKEQALYFDAHVLDAQRRRHDVRGCRCRFLVRYDHDQSEEIVPLRKICRRPETDYRLQQLHAVNESVSANQIKSTANNNSIHTGSSLRVYPPAEAQLKQNKAPEAPHKRPRLDSVVPPEGTEKQSKVEPDVMTDVPQNQQTVQPAVPASSSQPIVEPQKVEPMAPFPSNQASLAPKEAELAVPVPSAQGSGESQNAVPIAPTIIDEVPVGFQQVQPVMLDVSTEVTVEPQKVETEVVVPLTEASEEHNKSGPVPSGEVPEAVGPAVPPSAEVPVGPHEGGSEVAEPQKELVVSSSSVQLPAELQEVQPDVPEQPHISNLETKTEEPVVRVSTKEPNEVEEPIENKSKEPDVSVYINVPDMVEAIESKIEGPVVPVTSNDPNVVQVTKTEEPVVPIFSSDPNVVLEAVEAKTEEPVVPVSTNAPNVVETIESNIEEPAVPVSSNDPSAVQEAKIEESVVPVSGDAPNVVQVTKTEEPVMPVSTNDATAVQEAKTEEHMVSVSSNTPNVVQETKTDEPVMPVYNNDPNVIQEVSEAQTEEPVVHVSPKDVNVIQPEESVLPASDPNFDQS